VLPWQRAPVSDERHQSRVLDDDFVLALIALTVIVYICIQIVRRTSEKAPCWKIYGNYNNLKIKVQTADCGVLA